MADPPEGPPTPHRRRPRYRGSHPRRFEEKYKELAPESYPEIVPHVLGRGQTPAGQHVSILVDEAVESLALRPGMRGADLTLGYGGHAQRFLESVSPGGALLALDVDSVELPKTEARLRRLGLGTDALITRRTNFAGLLGVLHEIGWHDGVDFVFADLGVSSMQIDDPARGFTFKLDGPLDMRMNQERGISALDWLAQASRAELERALAEDSDEPRPKFLARLLDERRAVITTTRGLADVVRAALSGRLPEQEVDLCVRRVFQTLRIEVNEELSALDALLRQLPQCLRPGGRAAFLSFHSGEDRRVKKAFQAGERDGTYARVADEIVRATPEERRANPRSASAKLRWAMRAG